jgi:hypothetical protein
MIEQLEIAEICGSDLESVHPESCQEIRAGYVERRAEKFQASFLAMSFEIDEFLFRKFDLFQDRDHVLEMLLVLEGVSEHIFAIQRGEMAFLELDRIDLCINGCVDESPGEIRVPIMVDTDFCNDIGGVLGADGSLPDLDGDCIPRCLGQDHSIPLCTVPAADPL